MELNFDYDLQEQEENYIVEQFMTVMNSEGYGKSYSFDENITNEYLIYKNNYKWVLEYNDDGHWETKEFTNIYDLCVSLLRYLNIDTYGYGLELDDMIRIPRGTKVVTTESNFFNDINTGFITDSYISSSTGAIMYDIITDDDRIITATRKIKGNNTEQVPYFVTIESFINHLSCIIDANKKSNVNEDETKALVDLLNKVIASKEEYLEQADCQIRK